MLAENTWCVVGLGNPGERYARHRHNIGFRVIDLLLAQGVFEPLKQGKKSSVWKGKIHSKASVQNSFFSVFLMKPLTYMNLVGPAVAEVVNFFKIPLGRVIVVHDDLALLPFKAKFKEGGGSGGHNGLRSLDQHIGSHYKRLRLGIGHPGNKAAVSSYVLENFTSEEEVLLKPWLQDIVTYFPLILEDKTGLFLTKVAEHVRTLEDPLSERDHAFFL